METSPLRMGFGKLRCEVCYQSNGKGSSLGARQGSRSQERTLCQTCLEKGHAMIRWCIVSGSWSQSRHLVWCYKPRRSSRPAVQHLFSATSQWKNRTRGGAQVFQIKRQHWERKDPQNRAV